LSTGDSSGNSRARTCPPGWAFTLSSPLPRCAASLVRVNVCSWHPPRGDGRVHHLTTGARRPRSSISELIQAGVHGACRGRWTPGGGCHVEIGVNDTVVVHGVGWIGGERAGVLAL